MKIPATLLSFVFHSTIPNYRDEIHYDIDAAIRRFGLTAQVLGSLAKEAGVTLPAAATVQQAAKSVEGAAYEMRRSNGEKRDRLAVATRTLIVDCLAPLLTAEVALGVHVSDDRSAQTNNLISHLYRLVYSPAYRATAPVPSGFDSGDWGTVKQALQAGHANFSNIETAVRGLCSAVSAEFIGVLWPVVW